MDMLGIGNAIVDIFSFSEEETSLSLGLHPNSAVHMDCARLNELLLMVKNPVMVAGGSASNALKAASAMGLSCSFIGCTGTEDHEADAWARVFAADLASFRIETHLEERNMTSGRCLVIHMPGGLKAIACAPGAASTIRPEQIQADIVSRSSLVHIDGQLLRNAASCDRVSNLCRGFGIPLSIDLANASIARAQAGTILELIERNDCILFMDRHEAFAFAQAARDALHVSAAKTTDDMVASVFEALTGKKRAFPYIVRKEGPMGASAWSAGSFYHQASQAINHPLDDTAAGDIFAGAFLSAYLRRVDIEDALDVANQAARASLSVPGSRIDWNEFTSFGDEIGALIPQEAEAAD